MFSSDFYNHEPVFLNELGDTYVDFNNLKLGSPKISGLQKAKKDLKKAILPSKYNGPKSKVKKLSTYNTQPHKFCTFKNKIEYKKFRVKSASKIRWLRLKRACTITKGPYESGWPDEFESFCSSTTTITPTKFMVDKVTNKIKIKLQSTLAAINTKRTKFVSLCKFETQPFVSGWDSDVSTLIGPEMVELEELAKPIDTESLHTFMDVDTSSSYYGSSIEGTRASSRNMHFGTYPEVAHARPSVPDYVQSCIQADLNYFDNCKAEYSDQEDDQDDISCISAVSFYPDEFTMDKYRPLPDHRLPNTKPRVIKRCYSPSDRFREKYDILDSYEVVKLVRFEGFPFEEVETIRGPTLEEWYGPREHFPLGDDEFSDDGLSDTSVEEFLQGYRDRIKENEAKEKAEREKKSPRRLKASEIILEEIERPTVEDMKCQQLEPVEKSVNKFVEMFEQFRDTTNVSNMISQFYS